jgi:hypothetical protein
MLEFARRTYSSETVLALKLASVFNLDDELKNVISVVFRPFAFLHSQGHLQTFRERSANRVSKGDGVCI